MKKAAILLTVVSLCLFFALSLHARGTDPSIVKLNSLPGVYTAVTFDHQKHSLMAGECSKCHHEHKDSKSLTCKNCHAISPAAFKDSVVNSFIACKNCHSAYNPANPEMPGLKVAYHRTCFECHRGMGNIGLDPKGCTQMCHAKK